MEPVLFLIVREGRADKRQIKNPTRGLAQNIGGEPYAPTASVVIVGLQAPGLGEIIWKGVLFKTIQGVTEDTGYDRSHDPSEPRNLRIKPTAPRDPCTVPGGFEEDLPEVIPYPEASFYDPVGHSSGAVEFENLFVELL